jgi:hypothetical protein
MKKHEKGQLECDIKSNQLIAGQAIWECLGALRYKLEHSECIDNTEIERLIRKLTTAQNAIDRNDTSFNAYIKNDFTIFSERGVRIE